MNGGERVMGRHEPKLLLGTVHQPFDKTGTAVVLVDPDLSRVEQHRQVRAVTSIPLLALAIALAAGAAVLLVPWPSGWRMWAPPAAGIVAWAGLRPAGHVAGWMLRSYAPRAGRLYAVEQAWEGCPVEVLGSRARRLDSVLSAELGKEVGRELWWAVSHGAAAGDLVYILETYESHSVLERDEREAHALGATLPGPCECGRWDADAAAAYLARAQDFAKRLHWRATGGGAEEAEILARTFLVARCGVDPELPTIPDGGNSGPPWSRGENAGGDALALALEEELLVLLQDAEPAWRQGFIRRVVVGVQDEGRVT